MGSHPRNPTLDSTVVLTKLDATKLILAINKVRKLWRLKKDNIYISSVSSRTFFFITVKD